MFLPECLKKCDPNMKVGWFLHTPFPSSEIYGTLPSRSELLRSVLTADVVNHSVLIIMFFSVLISAKFSAKFFLSPISVISLSLYLSLNKSSDSYIMFHP